MYSSFSLSVKDPFTGEEFAELSFEKAAAAEGKQFKLLALNAMETPSEVIDSGSISLLVRKQSHFLLKILYLTSHRTWCYGQGNHRLMNMRSAFGV
ncbi:MAG: hypothetical protein R2757_18120 [Draconibacterium sp.]